MRQLLLPAAPPSLSPAHYEICREVFQLFRDKNVNSYDNVISMEDSRC